MENFNFEENTNRNRNKKCNLCKRFAEILGAEIIESREGLCVVGFNRDLEVEILGVRTRSPLVLPVLFSFEPARNNGRNRNSRNNENNRSDRDDRDNRNNERALNLGEIVLLQEEVNDFITVLRRNNIIVTALHNHWLFEEPRLMYLHFESVDQPLDFARGVAEALKTLRRC